MKEFNLQATDGRTDECMDGTDCNISDFCFSKNADKTLKANLVPIGIPQFVYTIL